MEKGHQFLIDNVGKVAAEFTKGGEVRQVEEIDARKDEKYRPVLAMIPKDVLVCRAKVTREQGTSGSSTFLLIDGRWVWFRGLEAIPAFLEKMK
jgi:hypothetical protein